MLISNQCLFDQDIVTIVKGDKMNIDQMLEHFKKLYSRRNRLCFPYGLNELLQLMGYSFSKLDRSIRKNNPIEIVSARLADTIAWFCGVVNYFDNLPLALAFAAKYGKTECPYCEVHYCVCDPESRPEPEKIFLQTTTTDKRGRTIDWWCDHLNKIFGQRNREKGIHRILNHLIEEMHEVLLLTGIAAIKPNELKALEEQFAFELADVLAHLMAIKNLELKKIDLSVIIKKCYGHGCPTCKENPLSMPPSNLRWRKGGGSNQNWYDKLNTCQKNEESFSPPAMAGVFLCLCYNHFNSRYGQD